MKGKAKKRDCRDISGTVCDPNAVLAFLMAALIVAVLVLPLPFFNRRTLSYPVSGFRVVD